MKEYFPIHVMRLVLQRYPKLDKVLQENKTTKTTDPYGYFIFHKHEYENTTQNTSKQNQATYKKNYIPWSCGVYPNFAWYDYHLKIKSFNTAYRSNKKQN